MTMSGEAARDAQRKRLAGYLPLPRNPGARASCRWRAAAGCEAQNELQAEAEAEGGRS